MENITGVILAGGNSRRMGQNKALMDFKGKSFIENIIENIKKDFPVAISCNKNELYTNYNHEKIVDEYEDIGPIGGIYSSLKSLESDYIWAISCDTPLVSSSFGSFLYSYISSDYDGFIPVARNGKLLPTLGIYSKSAIKIIEKMIREKNYRLVDLCENMKSKYVYMEYSAFPDSIVTNINNYIEYNALMEKKDEKEAPIIAVSGIKNSGKTTLITKLIPELVRRGYRVCTIKHDGHDFSIGKKETDTFKHLDSGSQGTAIFSKSKYMVIRNKKTDERVIREYFKDADIILLEGLKNSKYPKIEVMRRGISEESLTDPKTLVAIASDFPANIEGVPVYGLDDIENLCDRIEEVNK